jgi:hypothetical protein
MKSLFILLLGTLFTFPVASPDADAKRWISNGKKFQSSRPATGDATLSWSIPATRENGDSLGTRELAGYKIYYTAEQSGASYTVTINDPNKTTYTVAGLYPDTYYFAISAQDHNGLESELSDIVSATIQ